MSREITCYNSLDFAELPLEPQKGSIQLLFFTYAVLLPDTCKQTLMCKASGVSVQCYADSWHTCKLPFFLVFHRIWKLSFDFVVSQARNQPMTQTHLLYSCWDGSVDLAGCQTVHHFGPEWNISITSHWIAKKQSTTYSWSPDDETSRLIPLLFL